MPEYNSQQRWWWGYIHSNGKLQIKPWFGDKRDYTSDCENNPFVKEIFPPFIAESKEQARNHIIKNHRITQNLGDENLPLDALDL